MALTISTGGEEVGSVRQERRRASAADDRRCGGGGNNKGEGEAVVAEAAGVEEGVGGRRRAKQEKGRQWRANSRCGCISSAAAPHCGRVERAVEHWHQGGAARYGRQPVGEQLGAGDGRRQRGEELRMGGGWRGSSWPPHFHLWHEPLEGLRMVLVVVTGEATHIHDTG
uniref:Uncharacterized protein n=1 Tax=Oryza nivara TaxID=4536 RepID=A0A0E0G9Y5_ORYNI